MVRSPDSQPDGFARSAQPHLYLVLQRRRCRCSAQFWGSLADGSAALRVTSRSAAPLEERGLRLNAPGASSAAQAVLGEARLWLCAGLSPLCAKCSLYFCILLIQHRYTRFVSFVRPARATPPVMPASLFPEMERSSSGGLEDQRALQLALELSMLGLNNENDSLHPNLEADTRNKKSQNTTECVPVPSSEHVAEIVGRQGEPTTLFVVFVRGASPLAIFGAPEMRASTPCLPPRFRAVWAPAGNLLLDALPVSNCRCRALCCFAALSAGARHILPVLASAVRPPLAICCLSRFPGRAGPVHAPRPLLGPHTVRNTPGLFV